MSKLSDEQVSKLIQNVQSAEQFVQEAKQLLASAQQTGGSLAADTKSLGIENIRQDIKVDEAYERGVFNDSSMYAFNDKSLKAIEIKQKELDIQRQQHDFGIKQQLDAIMISERENASLIKHLVNTLTVDTRTFTYESQLPLIDDDQTVKNESK